MSIHCSHPVATFNESAAAIAKGSTRQLPRRGGTRAEEEAQPPTRVFGHCARSKEPEIIYHGACHGGVRDAIFSCHTEPKMVRNLNSKLARMNISAREKNLWPDPDASGANKLLLLLCYFLPSCGSIN